MARDTASTTSTSITAGAATRRAIRGGGGRGSRRIHIRIRIHIRRIRRGGRGLGRRGKLADDDRRMFQVSLLFAATAAAGIAVHGVVSRRR